MAVAIMFFCLKSVVLNGMSPSNPSSQGSGDYAEEEAERLYIYIRAREDRWHKGTVTVCTGSKVDRGSGH